MRPSFYGRYIDDIGTIIDNELVARENLQRMNQEHKTIKFEMELPGEDGFLPLLDTQIKINERGEVERKLYSKAANKGLFLNFESHHPTSTKRAVATNEIKRAIELSTKEHRNDALEATRTKLASNGYPASWLSDLDQKHTERKKKNEKTKSNQN